MSSGFTVYKSSDASAPTLSGTAGDLVNVLDKCLVSGYGSQSPAGWTKPFTGVNKAAFKLGAGTGFYMRIQDDGPGAGGAKEARIVGYESMTTVDAGTNPFPTVAQAANGQFIRKSATADATVRKWWVFADARTVYMLVETGDISLSYFLWAFGDFYSLVPGDLYNCMLIARSTENSAIAQNADIVARQVNPPASFLGHYIARGYSGLTGAIAVYKLGPAEGDTSGSQVMGNQTSMPFPNPTDGKVYIGRLMIMDATTQPTQHRRGWYRGFWQICHAIAVTPSNLTFSGTDDLAGRTFFTLAKSEGGGIYCFETSTTLDTN